MKIALVSNDGKTISAHFGRARLYVVVTVEDGRVVDREVREKAHHAHGHHHDHRHDPPVGSGRGDGPGGGARPRHQEMIEPIRDCDLLVSRGMGTGAYAGLQAAGIRPILTDLRTVDEAVQAYLEGRLVDHPERLHR